MIDSYFAKYDTVGSYFMQRMIVSYFVKSMVGSYFETQV